MVQAGARYTGTIVEYLDRDKLRPAVVVGENGKQLVVVDSGGREKLVHRDLILIRHPEPRADVANPAAALAAIESERAQLATELDLNLLWEVVHEQNRDLSAQELAELYFGRRSSVAAAVMLEALLNDRLYFTRRHMEFVARSAEQVERLRFQHSRERLKSEGARKTRALIRDVLNGGPPPPAEDAAELVAELRRYLANPFTRRQAFDTLLGQAMPEVPPAEVAVEVLERLGAAPDAPRFALVGGLPQRFSEAALAEASAIEPPARAAVGGAPFAITIDDPETLEVDDALSCVAQPDGSLRVSIHIALCTDFVPRDGAMDKEAAVRAATVYLPEVIIRMLPEEISCRRASLLAGAERPVLTTDVSLGPQGELLSWKIYPGQLKIGARADYDAADRLLAHAGDGGATEPTATLKLLLDAAMKLRERRRRAGALLFHRRELKVKVHGGAIEVRIIDSSSLSRTLVAEFMVLNNYVAARWAADNRLPIIYRVQPSDGHDSMIQRARLSLYPEYHAGIGLDCYAQLSSPIRRYADLVMQRQLVAALGAPGARVYDANELLTILAHTENNELEAKELERRAKRYWILRYLERTAPDRPLAATMLRDGTSAELNDYAVRGALHGFPTLPDQAQMLVRIERIDPLRGWLALSYAGPTIEAVEKP